MIIWASSRMDFTTMPSSLQKALPPEFSGTAEAHATHAAPAPYVADAAYEPPASLEPWRDAGMTPGLLRELSSYREFPKTAEELIGICGLESAAHLIAAWGGQDWPVPARVGGANPCGARRYESLVRVVGDTAARRLVQEVGGLSVSIPNLKGIKKVRIGRLIRAEFDVLTTRGGHSSRGAIFELGIKYGLTSRAIENTLKRPDEDTGRTEVRP